MSADKNRNADSGRDAIALELIRPPDPGASILTLPNGCPVVVHPAGWTAASIEKWVPPRPPAFRFANVEMSSVISLVDYLARFGGPASTIYMDPDAHAIVSVLDDGDGKTTGRRVDRVSYAAEFDEAFEAWSKACAQPMGRADFVRFVEDNDRHFITPNGATMRTLVKQLDILRTVEFRQLERDDTAANDVTLHYQTTTQEKGDVKLPGDIKIGIPVFAQLRPFQIDLRFRYDLDNGRLLFYLRMPERTRIIDGAWQAVTTELEQLLSKTERKETPVFIGAPPEPTITRPQSEIVW